MSTVLSAKSIANRQTYLWKERASLLLSLGKIRISLLVTFSTATGYLLAAEEVTIQMLVPAAAVFLLACGSCALNQFQERKIDALMERTRNRPIPSGKLNPSSALLISLGLISVGSFTLFCGASLLTGILGLLAIFWYNGVYTYLKRKSAFAVIPGALIGAIPPTLGWISGGGHLLDPRILVVAFLFFIWQVPHFWLLLLDFGKDYEKAGLPSLTRIFTRAQLSRITFMWISATAVACMVTQLFGIAQSLAIRGGLFISAFWLVWKGSKLLKVYSPEFPFHFAFNTINSYAFVVMVLFNSDKLFR
jgi:protoheme IX farnesyltransferase